MGIIHDVFPIKKKLTIFITKEKDAESNSTKDERLSKLMKQHVPHTKISVKSLKEKT